MARAANGPIPSSPSGTVRTIQASSHASHAGLAGRWAAVVRGIGAGYVLVMLLLSAGLAVLAGYVVVSGYPLVGVPLLLVAAFGFCHLAILIRWLRTPARVTYGPDVLRIASPAVLRSEVVVGWADIELAWVRFGASSISGETVVLAPLAVPVDVLLRLTVDVSPDARRWLGVLVEPMGSWYGDSAQMPRPGRTYRRLAFKMPSGEELVDLESELRRHGVPVGG